MRGHHGILKVTLKHTYVNSDNTLRHPSLTAGSYVLLEVSDTGHGITPQDLPRIFDPFFTTNQVGEGTGMGLSIVHGIVTSYGGTILVDSQPDQGTAFTIYFPMFSEKERVEVTD